jgi:hypothetical protein
MNEGVVDQIYAWLTAFLLFMDSWSLPRLAGLFVFLASLRRLEVVAHEAVHALTGMAFGARVREVVACSGDGPALRFRLGATQVRIGARLPRLGSKTAAGWVRFDDTSTASAWQAVLILLAGAGAEVILGTLLLVTVLSTPVSGYASTLLVIGSVQCLVDALGSFFPRQGMRTDGELLRAVLSGAPGRGVRPLNNSNDGAEPKQMLRGLTPSIDDDDPPR